MMCPPPDTVHITVKLLHVRPSTYAVAVHHDANANGTMDSNFLGMPKEGYGVSNDVRSRFRPPRFSEASVRVTRDTTLLVHLSY